MKILNESSVTMMDNNVSMSVIPVKIKKIDRSYKVLRQCTLQHGKTISNPNCQPMDHGRLHEGCFLKERENNPISCLSVIFFLSGQT